MDFHSNDFLWRHVFSDEYFAHHGVTIEHTTAKGGQVLIRGIHLSDTNLGFQAQYDNNSAVNNIADQAKDAVTGKFGAGGAAASAAGNVVKQNAMGTSASMNDTIKVFAGVPNPTFDIEILLIKGAQNHTEYVKSIDDSLRMILPPDELEGIGVSSLIAPPMGVKTGANPADPKSRFKRDMGCVIAIGKQYQIDHMLCEDFSFTESPQKRSDGHPLYIKCKYRFTAGRVLTVGEVRNWFISLRGSR